MQIVLLVLVLISGMLIPMQIAANKTLLEAIKSPPATIAIALGLGALTAGVAALTGLGGRVEFAGARSAPAWAWMGGLLVAFSLIVQVIKAREGGMGPIIALIVAGQLTSAMVIDHFGWLRTEQDPIRWWKLAGAVLMAGGAAMLQIKGK